MNFRESKPIYLQIAERLMDEMLQSVYMEEQRIPSVREYAAIVEVNANTVMRAYDYLQGKNVIYNKRGIGYFVSSDAKNRVLMLRKEQFLKNDLPEMFRKIRLLGIPMSEIVSLYERNQTTGAQ